MLCKEHLADHIELKKNNCATPKRNLQKKIQDFSAAVILPLKYSVNLARIVDLMKTMRRARKIGTVKQLLGKDIRCTTTAPVFELFDALIVDCCHRFDINDLRNQKHFEKFAPYCR